MNEIKEVAYAKINLGLDILGKRADGYHEVSMIMQSVGLCDEIVISPGSGEGKITISTNIPGLSCGSDNLAYKAAALLAKHAGIIPNVHIALNKKIFLAAGLAGGSADAAAVLRGLNKYWQLHLENHELESLAALLGSDIPFCIEGGTMLATGRGEVLTKLADLPETIVVLAKPRHLEVSTAWVYQHYDKGRVVQAPCIWQLEDRLTEGAPALVPYMGNVLETVTIPAHPVIASIKAAMLGAGAYFALMSGSGPTVFALAHNQETATRILAALADFDVETAITSTVGRIQ
ncbi:MAG: 4-(cytidine 5'-diphospho)-2-C-methyl-D-erythritol kinase [Phascolarctobacterium sp.]